jgi:hypothetical protein
VAMNAIGIRRDRWRDPAEGLRSAVIAAPAVLMTQSRERAAVSEGRAKAAMTISASAWRLASARLDCHTRDQRAASGLTAISGITGITGLILLIVIDLGTGQSRLIFGAIAAFAACAPIFLCISRFVVGANGDARQGVATECARMLHAQAKRIGDAVLAASDQDGLSAAKHAVLDILLGDLEQATATIRKYETRLPENADVLRRGVRIRPHSKSVVIATGDARKFSLRIVDVSQSGVAVEGLLPGIGVGSDAVVGSRKAKVVRLPSNGVAFEFSAPIPVEQFDRDIVL